MSAEAPCTQQCKALYNKELLTSTVDFDDEKAELQV